MSQQLPVQHIDANPAGVTRGLRDLWRRRELLRLLAARDVRLRYSSRVVGAAWALAQPLFLGFMVAFVFGRYARVPSDGVPFAPFALVGIVAWSFLANAIGSATQAILSYPDLITKVNFPRLAIPLAAIAAHGVDLLTSAIVVLLLVPALGGRLAPTAPLAVVLLIPLLMVTAGVGLLLAALVVRFRDARHALPFVLQAWFFASPIVYPTSLLPEPLRSLAFLNPVAGIIEGARSLLLGSDISPRGPLLSAAVALAVALLGLAVFQRLERQMADLV